VLLRGESKRDYERSPQIFQVGCAGRIVNVEQLPDGRSNILLHGVREFRIVEEVAGKAYRQAVVDWLRRDTAVLDETHRVRLVESLQNYLHDDPQSPAHQILAEDTLADEILVNFFSYVLDVPPLEKQALLEEPTLSARAERLCEVVAFRSAATTAGGDDPTPGRFH